MTTSDEDAPLDAQALLDEGVRLFNAREFLDAHEAWEALWVEESGGDRRLLQGLVQAAAAFHKLERGVTDAGVRLLTSALPLLRAFPDGRLGLGLGDFVPALEACLREANAVCRGERPAFDLAQVPLLRRVEGPR